MKNTRKIISILVLFVVAAAMIVQISCYTATKAASTSETTASTNQATASSEASGTIASDTPKGVDYVISSDKAGYADGTVTITPPADTSKINGYVLYWGDANGKLSGYAEITSFQKNTTKYTMNANTYIPSNATRLLAYSTYGASESAGYAAFNIPESARMKADGLISKFQVISDLHIVSWEGSANKRLANALKDIKATAPDTDGIFTVGDNINDCAAVNYNKLMSIVAQNGTGLPKINFGIGNHEYFDNAYSGVLTISQKAAMFLEKTGAPGLYYDKYINGQHFITLGSENVVDVDANISDKQFKWLESKLAETKYDKKPIFLFLHQSMADTVSGSIGGKSGQGWNGMKPDQEKRMRAILTKYPQVVLFNGHSHWDITSPHEMYDGGTTMPDIFNDGAVAMLWTDAQVEEEGSQGLFVETYADKILVRGRDFENHEWIPSAAFVIDLTEKYSVITPKPTPVPGAFTDTEGNWAYTAITDMAKAGILNGYSDGSFMPDANATRAEFANILMKMVKQEATTTASFTDTSSSAWYAKALSLAVEKGWINGRDDGSFGPNESIKREEAMSIISRLLNSLGTTDSFDESVLKGYTDASSISAWAKADIERLVGLGVIKGSNNMLKPKEMITRAEICIILSRVMAGYLNK